MSRFVERIAGAIVASYARAQPGRAEEELPDNDPALMAFESRVIARPPQRSLTEGDVATALDALLNGRAVPAELRDRIFAARSSAALGGR